MEALNAHGGFVTNCCRERGLPSVVTEPVDETGFSDAGVTDEHHFEDSLGRRRRLAYCRYSRLTEVLLLRKTNACALAAP